MKNYLFCAVLLLLISCDKNPTKIEKEKSLRHADLTQLRWTVDTLKVDDPEISTVMHAMWGSARDDIWVGGRHGELFQGKLWHYDGKIWQKEYTGGINGLEISEIWGFAVDDIWAVGQRLSPQSPTLPANEPMGVILHYDGTGWTEAVLPARNFAVTALGGTGPDELYAGGGPKGIMYKYNGSKWSLDSIYVPVKLSQTEGNETVISRITRSVDGDVFLLQNVRRDWEVVPHPYLYKRENDKWVLKDSSNHYLHFDFMWMSPEGMLYLIGGQIVTWSEGQGFIEQLDTPQKVGWLGLGGWDSNLLLCGRSYDTTKGILYHYDGSKWAQIFSLPNSNIYFFQPFFVDNVVYLRGVTVNKFPSHTLIFKGTLSN